MGITPACAGNTEDLKEESEVKRDHPRLRGEYGVSTFTDKKDQGSPPPARGIH